MNLPALTAMIGRAFPDDDIYSVLYPEPRKSEKSKQPYVVYMTFDLCKNVIVFEDLTPYSNDSNRKFNYFGNNKAAAKQFHVVREGKHSYFFMGLWANLKYLLEKNGLQNLAHLLTAVSDKGLIEAENGQLALEKIEFVINNPELGFSYDIEKKRIVQKSADVSEEISFEAFIRRAVGGKFSDQIVLVVPRIITSNGETVEVAKHEDYLELIRRTHKLGEKIIGTHDKNDYSKANQPEMCYICGLSKNDIACIEYSTKFRRDGINKVFTTTTINYANNIEASGHEHNYAFCKDCFDDLRRGEQVVLNQLTTLLAREKTFILPEGLLEDFEYQNISEITREIDFVFKPQKAEEWLRGIEVETRELHMGNFNLNFIIYDTDGNSITILQTISDVNSYYFIEILEVFRKYLLFVSDHLKIFSLGSIYHVIPVKTKKDGKQIDVGRILSFYKSILKREQIKNDLVYRYALEAMDKGLKQLASDKVRNYYNLGLEGFKKIHSGQEDYFIKRIIFAYLVILHSIQELGIGKGISFLDEGESMNMNEMLKMAECPESILEAEEFLANQHFTNEMKALFFLGLIMKRVALAQAAKKHKNKPIFKKVNFQGMKQKHILRFYEDLVEKLRQYNKINFYTEWLMNRFHYYMGAALTKEEWSLGEHANVFFIMSGYAFQVGKKTPGLSKDEEDTIEAENKDMNIEEDDIDGTSDE